MITAHRKSVLIAHERDTLKLRGRGRAGSFYIFIADTCVCVWYIVEHLIVIENAVQGNLYRA